MARSPLIVSAQVILYVNGKPYAQVTGFRWDVGTPTRAIHGVDSSEPYELAPTTTKITGAISLLRVIRDGGVEGAGMSVKLDKLSRRKYFTLALVERVTDTMIFSAKRCQVQNQSWDVPAKGRITGNLSFEALDYDNEAQARER